MTLYGSEDLPKPRVVIAHGPVDSDADYRTLLIVTRTYHGLLGHGMTGMTMGGNEWVGYHLSDPEAVEGLGEFVAGIAEGRGWAVITQLADDDEQNDRHGYPSPRR